MSFEGIALADPKLSRGATDRPVKIGYWTVKDEETMRELIE